MNLPEVKLGIVAVSRDCFPIELSHSRREKVVKACGAAGLNVYEAETIIENEKDTLKALEEIDNAGVNALVVYLGNFGPEGPETMLAQKFNGPVMLAAAGEEASDLLISDRGDALCGMLNASYNLGLRGVKAYIPEYPIGTPDEVAGWIGDFENIARVIIGVKNLKIVSYGPRPFDFLACNAPIKPLFDIGVEIKENSELDLMAAFNAHADDPRIPEIVKDMEQELDGRNNFPAVLPKLAQYEATLMDLYEEEKGASKFAVFANKCWPAFQTQFGFVPCYVNARLAARGIPVACETDIYGALSEYILACATNSVPTLLDINNSVPKDMYEAHRSEFEGFVLSDTFMGFHCGNTASCMVKNSKLDFQRIMHRGLEPDSEPNITRGTFEGNLKAGDITIFRLQSTADTQLRSYMAEGKTLDVDPQSFGSIGVMAVPEMGRFYRHVLIEKCYPHHGALAYGHAGKVLFEAMKLLGVADIAYNQPKSLPYPTENPFA